MGAGDKFRFDVTPTFGLGFYVSRFPHQLSLGVHVLWFSVYLGFGKGYDELG